MKILIADGGTGGHIFPAIAVADELKKRSDVEAVLFTGTPLGLESDLVPRHGYDLRMINVGGLIGKSPLMKLKTLLQLPFAYWESRKIVKSFQPDVVIGFGAYASGPVLLAAHHQRVPLLLVEPNAIPGFTNRIVLKYASKVAVAYDDKEGRFQGKAIVTGNPIRNLQVSSRSRLEACATTVGIFGGSQGARAINQCILAALTQLYAMKDKLHLIHQTGKADYAALKKAYEEMAPEFEVIDFVHNVEEFYNRCDLLICRAGAITLAELAALGKPAILVPLPTAAHNHQEQNARRLQESGAAMLILQKDLTPQTLMQTIQKFLENPGLLKEMSEASQRLGKPDATKNVVDLALSLARSQQKAG